MKAGQNSDYVTEHWTGILCFQKQKNHIPKLSCHYFCHLYDSLTIACVAKCQKVPPTGKQIFHHNNILIKQQNDFYFILLDYESTDEFSSSLNFLLPGSTLSSILSCAFSQFLSLSPHLSHPVLFLFFSQTHPTLLSSSLCPLALPSASQTSALSGFSCLQLAQSPQDPFPSFSFIEARTWMQFCFLSFFFFACCTM